MKSRSIEKIVVFFAACTFSLLFSLNAHAFRCGDEIVGTGDSKAKVLVKCGKPTYKEKAAKTGRKSKGGRHADGNESYAHNKRGKSGGMEKWSYNCGKEDFIYVLTFENGVVVREDTDGRGRGRSECLGR
jgi:hypothetical protein